ncbi:MAG: tRNA (adenosine(37)-N6)-dimethylallyltransferase MiaA [Actinobacteria bacterium]|nr:MAG: tRNA (adenosine(37)-N6)-dimethylallyltransferase MiaA [Actinomycetota bacterium]
MRARTRVIAVVGPTGVGKTDVAEQLALGLRGEIVTADSMQVYRGMDIGTAKRPPEERRVPHHCIDLVGPGEPYSAALYQSDARSAIDDIAARGGTPIVCGGTGLYLRAALDDWAFPPGAAATPERARFEALAEELGPVGVHGLLAETDPEAAALIHPNNVRRVIRALEMSASGTLYSEQARRFAQRVGVYDTTILGLDAARPALYERIEARVDRMMEDGLLAEVEGLLAAGYRDALTAAAAIGYKELVPVIEDGADVDEAVAAIKQATRRYAKRQLGWFRADPRVRWLDVTALTPRDAASQGYALVES